MREELKLATPKGFGASIPGVVSDRIPLPEAGLVAMLSATKSYFGAGDGLVGASGEAICNAPQIGGRRTG